MQLQLASEQKASRLIAARVALLERSVEDATLDGEAWRGQCSAMSQTLDEMVAVLPSRQAGAHNTHTNAQRTRSYTPHDTHNNDTDTCGSRGRGAEHSGGSHDGSRHNRSVDDIVAFALSSKPGHAWHHHNEQVKMHENELKTDISTPKKGFSGQNNMREGALTNHISPIAGRVGRDKQEKHVMFSGGIQAGFVSSTNTVIDKYTGADGASLGAAAAAARLREPSSFHTPGEKTWGTRQPPLHSSDPRSEQTVLATCLFPHNLSPIVPLR
jgi:hypothetical protein